MSLESNMNKSIIGSSNSAYDEHKPLGVVHDETPKIQAPSGSIFFNRDLTTTCKFFFFSCIIRK